PGTARQRSEERKKGQRALPQCLRQSFHEFAGCSIRYCDWARSFYKAQLRRGKSHHVALRALAFKWIRILFTCWKQRTPYNSQRYLDALKQRGSLYANACE